MAAISTNSFEPNSRSGTRHGCLYCSTLPPEFLRRLLEKTAQVPSGRGIHFIGANRPVARFSLYSQLSSLRRSSTL